jgi:hypothetical protein
MKDLKNYVRAFVNRKNEIFFFFVSLAKNCKNCKKIVTFSHGSEQCLS